MPAFFIVLLKINLVLVLFAAAYYLILRQLTFYVLNRFFLVFGILFSTVYPWIDLTDFFQKQSPKAVAFVPHMNQQIQLLVKPILLDEYGQWLSILFFVGLVLMGMRLIVQLVSLYKIHQNSTPGLMANFKVRILRQAVSPFSFWQTIYINPSLHKAKELSSILAHEHIHVKEWHSLDIILAELSLVFYWFNPGVWLMKKAVKENLEFIADEKTLQKGIDKKAYQYGLLHVGALVPAVEIVNHFNLSDLKKRIQMMNVKRSSKLTLSRYLLILPLLLLLTLAFTVSKKEMVYHFKPVKKALVAAHILDTLAVENQLVKQNKYPTKNLKRNIATDSLSLARLTNIESVSLSQINQAQPEAILKLNGKVILISFDTLSSQSKAMQDENINMFVAKGSLLNSTLPQFGQKVVEVRGYKTGTKLADSIKNAIFLNGEKLTVEQLNKIKPDAIKTINIRKNKNVPEIHLSGIHLEN